jgi:hypothetical protein
MWGLGIGLLLVFRSGSSLGLFPLARPYWFQVEYPSLSPHDGSREEPVCQGVCPAISVTLLRESRVEDACDMELALTDTHVSMAVLLTGTLGRDISPPRPLLPHCCFRVRPLSGSPAAFGYVRYIQVRPVLPRRVRCLCRPRGFLYCRERFAVTPPPVSPFSGRRARKRPQIWSSFGSL